jgi:hypothetical protein
MIPKQATEFNFRGAILSLESIIIVQTHTYLKYSSERAQDGSIGELSKPLLNNKMIAF